MGELKSTAADSPSGVRTETLDAGEGGAFATTRLKDMLSWAQKYSLFMYPFVTACCGMEFMSVSGPRFDFSRFGAEAPRFSPPAERPALGSGHDHPAPGSHLRRIYEQMMEPKYVLAFGTCASCGGFYDNYACVGGHRQDRSL